MEGAAVEIAVTPAGSSPLVLRLLPQHSERRCCFQSQFASRGNCGCAKEKASRQLVSRARQIS
jgi:hypothetical protein